MTASNSNVTLKNHWFDLNVLKHRMRFMYDSSTDRNLFLILSRLSKFVEWMNTLEFDFSEVDVFKLKDISSDVKKRPLYL